MLDVYIYTPQKILFEGQAKSVILPGEQGDFEILNFHKNILSRIISGIIFVDEKGFYVRRGVVKVELNTIVIVAEED